MQILGLRPRLTESEALGVWGAATCVVTSSPEWAGFTAVRFVQSHRTLLLTEPCAWFNGSAVIILEFLIIS